MVIEVFLKRGKYQLSLNIEAADDTKESFILWLRESAPMLAGKLFTNRWYYGTEINLKTGKPYSRHRFKPRSPQSTKPITPCTPK